MPVKGAAGLSCSRVGGGGRRTLQMRKRFRKRRIKRGGGSPYRPTWCQETRFSLMDKQLARPNFERDTLINKRRFIVAFRVWHNKTASTHGSHPPKSFQDIGLDPKSNSQSNSICLVYIYVIKFKHFRLGNSTANPVINLAAAALSLLANCMSG